MAALVVDEEVADEEADIAGGEGEGEVRGDSNTGHGPCVIRSLNKGNHFLRGNGVTDL